MRKIERVLREVATTPWLLEESRGTVLLEVLRRRAGGARISKAELAAIVAQREAREAAAVAAAAEASKATAGAVAVVPLIGVLHHRAGYFDEVSGVTSASTFAKRVRAADEDPGVKSIVLDVDSPGGSVEGIAEASAVVAGLAKPIVAVANAMAASAAYWIASQANELVVTPSGEVGSIGVLMVHEDISKWLEAEGSKVTIIRAGKFKAEGNPFEPLSDEAREEFQRQVDLTYDEFLRAVARGRGVSVGTVRSSFGQGRMRQAKEAVEAGMADRVATLEETVQRLSQGGRVRKRTAGEPVLDDEFDDIDLRERELSI